MIKLYKDPRNKRGEWYAEIQLRLQTMGKLKRDGKSRKTYRTRQCTGCTNKKDAQKWADTKRESLIDLDNKQVRGHNIHDLYLHDLLKIYYEKFGSVKGNLKDPTQHSTCIKRLTLKDFPIKKTIKTGKIKYYKPIPNVPVSEFKGKMVQDLINIRKEEGLRHSSIKKDANFIQGAFNWYERYQDDFYQPKIDWPYYWKQIPSFENQRVATPDELKAIAEAIGTMKNKYRQYWMDMFWTLYYLGARVGEVVNLRWSQIDWNMLEQNYKQENYGQQVGGILLERTKTNNETWITMSSELRKILLRRKNIQEMEEDDSCFVFQSPRKRMPGVIASNRSRVIVRAIDIAGLNDDEELVKKKGKFTIHSLRRTAATHMAKAGMSAVELQTTLGHSDLRMSQKYIAIAQNVSSGPNVLEKVMEG
mgnify:CR=1 FL=1|tara:strand:- start:161 stop:1417 length:1257 start_codon:yes stop_codon:yes gene_type:complete